jgi:hypothetical protein
MRDGVELGADLYIPLEGSKGLLLVRGPFRLQGVPAMTSARVFAGQGYSVLVVSTRGTANSGGILDPMRDEERDGHDIVAWMRKQEWYPGRFGTIGPSYLAYTQWALLAEPPEDLATSIVTMGPHDFSRHVWGTGTFNLDIFGWAEQMRQTTNRTARLPFQRSASARRLASVHRAVPMVSSADDYFRATAPWMNKRMEHPDLSDPFWAPMQHASALDKADIPILIQAGWQDIFLGQSMEQYLRLRARGVNVAMTVGAWAHVHPIAAQRILIPDSLAWLNHHLAGLDEPTRPTPVRFQMSDSGQWQETEEWPVATTTTTLVLHGDGRLIAGTVPTAAEPRSFVFDPNEPTPALGGNMLYGGGYKDDSDLASRNDVLTYETDPLADGLTLMGSARIDLAHTTEYPDADLFIRISDVDRRGRSRNVAEAYHRILDGGPIVTLDLLPATHTFQTGHRIRLLIAGGSFPQFPRNPGTAENPLTAAELKANKHTIQHSTGTSALHLPVLASDLSCWPTRIIKKSRDGLRAGR